MIGRLLVGLFKGLLLGGLLGYGLVRLGMPEPSALFAYLAAAVTGVVTGLFTGKPIWAKDAKIEAGMKATVGAVLGVGLMAAARTWLLVPIPFALGALGPEHTTVGHFAITALGAIAMLLGGFYEADNDPSEQEASAPRAAAQQAGPSKRIAAASELEEEEEELNAESTEKRTKR